MAGGGGESGASGEQQYIGRYRAVRVVGSGAFATVWLAEDEALAAPVAIKVLAENWAHDDEIRGRFLEEARILWRADSDHIVRIHNVDELPDGRPYFVMDYADRGTLQQRMQERASAGGTWSIDEAVGLSLAVASGLKVAHALGVVHRDLKPANIMFQSVPGHLGEDRDEKLILTDFGMAKSLARSRGTTIATGTPYYMAPEQTEGRADERSDIYSAGVVLYELLAGRVPYPYDSPGRLFQAQMSERPAPITTLRPDVPAGLGATLAQALSTDPNGRWSSADAWSSALSAAAEGKPVEPETPLPGVPSDMVRTMAPEEVAAAAAAAAAARAAAGPQPAAAAPGEPSAAAPAQPPAPPPPPPPAPPAAGGDRGRGRRRRGLVIGLPVAGVVAAVAAVVIVLVATGASTADAKTLTLDPVSVLGRNPFTASLVPKLGQTTGLNIPSNPKLSPKTLNQLGGSVTREKIDVLVGVLTKALNPAIGTASKLGLPLTFPATTNGDSRVIEGYKPGLYGGTSLLSVCDKRRLIEFLTQNVDKARAWAKVQGIAVEDIPAYISRLTDVVLQLDTRVTNHGFLNGLANPIDEVLQRGTAVLIDEFGIPRARCYCGNPLTPPRALASKPKITVLGGGKPWTGFSIPKTVVVKKTKKAPEFGTIDVITGDSAIYKKPGTLPADSTLTPQIIEPIPTLPPPPTVTTPTVTTPTATTPTVTTPTVTTPTVTTPTVTAPTTTTTTPTLTNVTKLGSVEASSVFSSKYPTSAAIDGNNHTSWFSVGDKEGPNSTFSWVSRSGPVLIDHIQLVSNAFNDDSSIRTGFTFRSVQVDVLKGGHVVKSTTIPYPSVSATVDLGVTGDTIRLLLIDHTNPACGGFGELRVFGTAPAVATRTATSITLSGPTLMTPGDTGTLSGRITGVTSGIVRIQCPCGTNGAWKAFTNVQIHADGTFSWTGKYTGSGTGIVWRNRARYAGDKTHAPSVSNIVTAHQRASSSPSTPPPPASPPPASPPPPPPPPAQPDFTPQQAIDKVKAVIDANAAACDLTWTSYRASGRHGVYTVTFSVTTSGNPGTATWNVSATYVTPSNPLAADIAAGCP